MEEKIKELQAALLEAMGEKQVTIEGKTYVMEYALKADFSLVKCKVADRYGNLTYNKTARNFGPIMCTAANTTIVQTKKIVEPGEIDPEIVVTPGIFVAKVVEVTNPEAESKSYLTIQWSRRRGQAKIQICFGDQNMRR